MAMPTWTPQGYYDPLKQPPVAGGQILRAPAQAYTTANAGIMGVKNTAIPATAQPSTGTNDWMAKYQTAFDAAKAANEARYNQALGEYQGLRTRSMQYLQGAGDQERKDINTQFAGYAAQAGQGMVDRGLAGTTVAPTVQTGIQRTKADALGALNERINQQKLATDAATTGNVAGVIERRTDAYPDAQLYLNLAQMEAALQPKAPGSSLVGGGDYAAQAIKLPSGRVSGSPMGKVGTMPVKVPVQGANTTAAPPADHAQAPAPTGGNVPVQGANTTAAPPADHAQAPAPTGGVAIAGYRMTQPQALKVRKAITDAVGTYRWTRLSSGRDKPTAQEQAIIERVLGG